MIVFCGNGSFLPAASKGQCRLSALQTCKMQLINFRLIYSLSVFVLLIIIIIIKSLFKEDGIFSKIC